MKIRSIGSLFASQSAAVGYDTEVREKPQSAEAKKPSRSDDAARLSLANGDSSVEDRQAKIAALKSDIANGNYNPRLADIAKAIARDLL